MSVPYASASSGEKSLGEIQKILTEFGCTRFGNFTDTEEGTVTIQFIYRNRRVEVTASAKGWAAMYLKHEPWNSRRQRTKADYEARAVEQGAIACFSMLRDWIKGQITAIESGILTFEGAFLGQILLPNGSTVLEHATNELKLLPQPEENS